MKLPRRTFAGQTLGSLLTFSLVRGLTRARRIEVKGAYRLYGKA